MPHRPPARALSCLVALVALTGGLTGCSVQAGVQVRPGEAGGAAVGLSVQTPDGAATTPGGGTGGTGPASSPTTPTDAPTTEPATASPTPSATTSRPTRTPDPTVSTAPSGTSSSTSPIPTSTPTSTPSATSPAPVTTCTVASLVAAVSPATANGSTSSATLTLTNLGGSPCRIRGFGGVSLARSDGVPVLSRQVRSGTATATVTLVPGGVARSTLTWSTVADTAVGEPATGDCEPVATSLLVIPPDQVDHLAVPWVAGPVCAQGTLTQTPYVPA